MKLNIAFYTLGALFNGKTIARKAHEDGDKALLEISMELVKLGHDITIFYTCDRPGVYDNVTHRSTDEFMDYCEKCQQDICVFSRMYESLPLANARVKALWMHDAANVKYYARTLSIIDQYISRYFMNDQQQLQDFSKTHNGISHRKLFLTRNCADITLDAMEWETEFFTLLKENVKLNLTPRATAQDMHQIATQFLNNGNYSPALESYRLLCEVNPSDAQAWHMRSAISGMIGNYSDSIQYCEKSLILMPDAAPVYANYANALMAVSRLNEALIAYEKTRQLNPDDMSNLVNMGKCLRKLGRHNEAISLYNKILGVTPGNSEAMDELGQVYFAYGDYPSALTCYKNAVHANPSSSNFRNNLGSAYQQLNEFTEAEYCFLECTKQEPGFLLAYCNLAYVYSTQGKFDKALECYNLVLSKNQAHEDAIAGKAVILERLGKFQSAYELVKPVIESNIYNERTALAYARLGSKFDNEKDAIQILEKFLDDPTSSHNYKTQAAYLSGTLYDRIGNYEKAFERFTLANELSETRFDKEVHRKQTEAIIAAHDRNSLATYPRSTSNGDGIIFVVGMPRSGTSLVEQILSSHPRVYGAGELTLIRDIASNIPRETGSRKPFPVEFERITVEILDKYSRTYLDHVHSLSDGKDIIIDKMPSNFLFLGLIQLLLPGARIIHCRRDPRDTCLSCFFQHFLHAHAFSHNFSDFAFFYNYYEKIMAHWKTSLSLPILDVQYENLVTNQEEISRQIIQHTGLEWNNNCLDFHSSDRKVFTASYDQVRKPMYTKSAGRWKNYRDHLSTLEESLDKKYL